MVTLPRSLLKISRSTPLPIYLNFFFLYILQITKYWPYQYSKIKGFGIIFLGNSAPKNILVQPLMSRRQIVLVDKKVYNVPIVLIDNAPRKETGPHNQYIRN